MRCRPDPELVEALFEFLYKGKRRECRKKWWCKCYKELTELDDMHVLAELLRGKRVRALWVAEQLACACECSCRKLKDAIEEAVERVGTLEEMESLFGSATEELIEDPEVLPRAKEVLEVLKRVDFTPILQELKQLEDEPGIRPIRSLDELSRALPIYKALSALGGADVDDEKLKRALKVLALYYIESAEVFDFRARMSRVYVFVDYSPSMMEEGEDGFTNLSVAVALAVLLLQELKDKAEVRVCAFGGRIKCFEKGREVESLLKQPEIYGTDIAGVLKKVLNEAEREDVAIIITDGLSHVPLDLAKEVAERRRVIFLLLPTDGELPDADYLKLFKVYAWKGRIECVYNCRR